MNQQSAILLLGSAAMVFFVNFFLVTEAHQDGSWGALGIMFIYGPITNGVLSLLALACTPLALRYTRGAFLLYLLAILLPVVAALIDAGIIGSMNLHGC